MKVDMSPQAVTARLKTLGELWLLSVKLMNSKKVEIKKRDKSKAKTALENLDFDAKKSQI